MKSLTFIPLRCISVVMITLEHLISHRFRGFAARENTVEGLKAALDFGVLNLEFDIRIARCGTPMIYHDEYAKDVRGKTHHLCDVMAKDYRDLGGTFAHMPTVDAFLAVAAAHANQNAYLLVDIKDAGFEAEIHALVMTHGLQDRVVYVSWVPECLYKLHNMAPDIPLCLSHWCQNPDATIRAKHRVFTARDGHISYKDRGYVLGERSGWYVNGRVSGDMLDILRASGGYVCVPQDMASTELVQAYHAQNIKVSTFSYIDWKHIEQHKNDFNIDLYFIDNKEVFETL